MKPLTHFDLFSGIGGFAIAAQAAGFQTIGFSEIEPYACKILKRHWPDIPNYGDIRNVRGVRCDLITGGFPCQPYSLAGKRAGASDDRALWPEMLRVIDESKPRWVLGENVLGIITMELDRVLDDLGNIGYSAWPIVVPACAVDARHRRDRVWIVGYAESQRTRPEELGGQRNGVECGSENVADANETGRREQRRAESVQTQHAAAEYRSPSLADASGNGRHERNTNGGRNEEGKIAAKERPRLADYCRWQPEPELGRVAHGIPNRTHRLKGLGNAIVPQVAEVLMREMAKHLHL